MRIHQAQRILQHRHHPESEQIDFDESHVGAVVLVPLDDDAIRHARVLEGNDVVEAAMAHHHPAGVLAKMPRQILDLLPQRSKELNRRIVVVETDFAQVSLERFLGIDPLEMVHDLGQPIDLLGLEREHFANFARGAAAAIRDDIGGHGDPGTFGVRRSAFGVRRAARVRLGVRRQAFGARRAAR